MRKEWLLRPVNGRLLKRNDSVFRFQLHMGQTEKCDVNAICIQHMNTTTHAHTHEHTYAHTRTHTRTRAHSILKGNNTYTALSWQPWKIYYIYKLQDGSSTDITGTKKSLIVTGALKSCYIIPEYGRCER